MVLGCALAAPAHALPGRTFVSATGLDSNSCAFSSPCRTLQGAYAKTAPNGEIDVLDPAGYGSLTIDHSMSIQGHGFAHIAIPSSGTGISINANPNDQNAPSLTVNLSGLILDGAGTGARAILFNGVGSALTVTDCVIRNVTGNGIEFAATTTSQLAVSDTMIEGAGNNGILIGPGGNGQVFRAALTRVQAYGNTNDGVVAVGASVSNVLNVTLTDSVLQGQNNSAVHAIGAVNVVVVGSALATNRTGLLSEQGTAHISVARSALMGHATTWSAQAGGAVVSFGNNDIAGNFDGDPVPPSISLE
jgi:hypothetical protein